MLSIIAGTTSPNPFDLSDLQSGLKEPNTLAPSSSSNLGPMASTGAKPKKPGGVQAILGEHSNLVNLDELVSSGKQPGKNSSS